ALGPIRVRQFGGITPGVWLSGTAATNRAFLGLVNENSVGIMGAVAGWALQADVNTANVGIKVAPGATNALTVSGNSFLNGNAGVGVDAPTTPASLKFDVAGRARFRDASGLMAAIQLFNTASSAPQDRALVGLQSDTNVGFFGNTGGGWGLLMNTTTGAVTAGVSLYGERVWSNNVHTEVNATTLISYVGSTNNVYVQVPNMLITFTLATVRPVWFYFHLPGVEMGSINSWTVGFRLTLDGNEIVGTEPVLNHTDYHQRTVTLSKLVSFVAAGIHTVRAEWWVSSNGVTMFGCRSGGGGSAGQRLLQVIEL
ncbi:MAG TPA: hypothetical protein VFB81_18455, partial [Myxococcales bacterium]|nr:hypothetical protein [Myxococcales bacterium]